MGRKNLGGDSYLRPNRSKSAYNETLAHVYQTAIANLDEKHTKRASARRRFRTPNFLSLCLKSAVNDVVDNDSNGDPHESTNVPLSPNRNDMTDTTETTPDVFADNDAVFLTKDGGIGHASHYRAPSGMSTARTKMVHAMQSMMKRNVSGKHDVYTA